MDVEEAGNLFLSQYKSDKQQFEGITPYQIQIVDTITFQNHSLVSLQRSGSEYLGGAHPIDGLLTGTSSLREKYIPKKTSSQTKGKY